MRWHTDALGNLVTDAKVGFACGEQAEAGVFQIRMNNITKDGTLDLSKMRRIPKSVRNWEKFQLRPGDVLFNATNSPELVGKTAVFEDCGEPAVFSNHFVRIRPDEMRLDSRFLARWLQLQFHKQVFRSMCRQWVNQATVGRDALLALKIPLPPLAKQRLIAEILGQTKALRATRREAIIRLDELTRSIFLEMFSGSRSDNWTMTTVERVARTDQGSIRTGPFGSQLLHGEFVDNGVAVLGIDNVVTNDFRWEDRRFVTEAKHRELNRYTVRPGDVLITIMGTCGRCAVAPDDIPLAINTKHLCCITLDRAKCLPVFMRAYFLLHPVARRYLNRTAKGAIMSGLNMGIIKAMPLALPPLALQREFADLVGGVERLKASHRAHLAELDTLFASLHHRAFRGEL
ncbi:MAG: restriction endonuclease subunit S [Pseudonocardiaceae bacterium]